MTSQHWQQAKPMLTKILMPYGITRPQRVNGLKMRPRQDGRHFPDDIFKCIILNENVWIPIKISLKFVPKGPINNIPAMVPIMAWRRPGDKPFSEPMMVSLLTHICITRPQWVNGSNVIGMVLDMIYNHVFIVRSTWCLLRAWCQIICNHHDSTSQDKTRNV